MRRITNNHALVVLVTAVAVYWAMATVIPSSSLREIFNGLALGVALTIVFTWFPAAYAAFRRGGDSAEDQMILAVFLTWTVLIMSRLYTIVYTFLGRPEWLYQSPVGGFIGYMIVMAGMLYLAAPGIMPGAPPGRYKLHILVSLVIGAALAGFVIGFTFATATPTVVSAP